MPASIHRVTTLALLASTCALAQPQPTPGEPIELDAPGVLDQPGATYVLTKDLTVPRTAFMIKADGITLDLGGYTVTYGTEVGVDRCSGVFLRPTGGESDFKGVPPGGFGGANNFTLRNGRLVQGKQPLATKLTLRYGRLQKAEGPVPGASCFAVYVRGCQGLEISGLTTEVNSRDTDNLYIRSCGDVKVHDNHCLSSVQEITNRHWPGTGVITVEGVNGPMDIHHNVVDGGGQWGIRVSGGGAHTGHLVEVHHNIVRHRSYTTNGYALGVHAPNMRVYANVVKPVAGRGVHLTGSGIDFYNNFVDVQEKPNPEYPRTRSHGIKLEGCRHTLVHHNFSRAIADEEYGDAAPLDFSVNTYSANRVFKNVIVADRSDDAGEHWATTVDLVGVQRDSLTQIHDNVFKTNHWHLRGDWGGASDVLFRDNTFELLRGPDDYQFAFFAQSRAAMSQDLVLRDCELIGGADLRKSRGLYKETRLDMPVEWTVTLNVVDPAGAPISGIRVVAREGERLAGEATTNAEGKAAVVLLDCRLKGNEEPTEEHGPYELILSGGGFEEKILTVDPTETTELPVTLTHPDRKLYAFAGVNQRLRISESATLEGKVAVVPEGAGKPEVKWTVKKGSHQPTIADPAALTTQTKLTQWGEVVFELTARLGEEEAKSTVTLRADEKITPVAVAGCPESVEVNTIVQLDGTGSTDPRRFPADQTHYKWKQVAGPEAILSSDEWPDPIFYATEPGRYEFELTFANPIRASEPVRCSVEVTQ